MALGRPLRSSGLNKPKTSISQGCDIFYFDSKSCLPCASYKPPLAPGVRVRASCLEGWAGSKNET